MYSTKTTEAVADIGLNHALNARRRKKDTELQKHGDAHMRLWTYITAREYKPGDGNYGKPLVGKVADPKFLADVAYWNKVIRHQVKEELSKNFPNQWKWTRCNRKLASIQAAKQQGSNCFQQSSPRIQRSPLEDVEFHL